MADNKNKQATDPLLGDEHADTTDKVVKKTEPPKDGTVVKLGDKMDVISTGVGKHLGAEGTKHTDLTRVHAEQLIKKGWAKKA